MATDTDNAEKAVADTPAETTAPASPDSVSQAETAPQEETATPDKSGLDRSQEVPALLGTAPPADPEETGDGAAVETELPVTVEEEMTNAEKPSESAMPDSSALAGITAELQIIREMLDNSSLSIRDVSTKIDALSGDTECLIKQVNSVSAKNDMLAGELEILASGANTKGHLSKTVLIVASVLFAALAASQIYLFTAVIRVQNTQHTAGTEVLKNISDLNKKMATYDSHLTKAMEKADQSGHSNPEHPAAEPAGHNTPAAKEAPAANGRQVLEKMNRLRGGLPERKLVRKETGDWFVYNKKIDECISDVEVIEALNQAYQKSGKSIAPDIPLPQHNALVILKPDGKGGTEIVVTREFVADAEKVDKTEKKKKK